MRRWGCALSCFREKRSEAVPVCLDNHFLQRQVFHFGNFFSNERQVERRILTATIGCWCEERGIGFQKDLADGSHTNNIPHVLYLVEGGDTIKAQVPALIQCVLGKARTGGEAVN